MTTPTRPLLRWMGSKWLMAPFVIQHLPPHTLYCEPFGGSASVLMRKPRSKNWKSRMPSLMKRFASRRHVLPKQPSIQKVRA